MVEKDWEPATIGRMSLGQLGCLLHPRAPADGRITCGDEWSRYQERQQAEADEWASSAS